MGYIPTNISTPNDGLGDSLRTFAGNADTMFGELYAGVVFKEAGKGLSTNDFTDLEQAKLANIASGAEVNVQPNWAQEDETADDFIKNKPVGVLALITSARFTGSGQSYTLPVGSTAIKGWINDAVQHLEKLGFESDLNTFTQTDNIVTFKKTISAGQRIYIDYYL